MGAIGPRMKEVCGSLLSYPSNLLIKVGRLFRWPQDLPLSPLCVGLDLSKLAFAGPTISWSAPEKFAAFSWKNSRLTGLL